jgi:cobalt/nickel transport system permease protein
MSLGNERFSVGSSPLHRAEQRAKILAAVALTLVAATVQTMAGAVLSGSAGIFLAACARLSPIKVVRALVPANMFFLFLFFTLPLTYPGEPLAWLPLLSQDGLWLALLITTKGNAVMLMVLALLGTNTPAALANGLYRLGMPQKLVLLLTFVYRQTFLSMREIERMRQAAEMRHFDPKLRLRTFKVYASILVQALFRSLDRAERIHDAMLMRGFEGRFHYLFPVPAVQNRDVVMVGFSTMAALFILSFDRSWLL